LVKERLRRGDILPGFGHPLYRNGDPRALALLRLLPPDPTRDALRDAMDKIRASSRTWISPWCPSTSPAPASMQFAGLLVCVTTRPR
jgi:citrate synthase